MAARGRILAGLRRPGRGHEADRAQGADDPFWQAHGALPLQPVDATGCGFDLSAYPANVVPLGGWDDQTVSLAYAPSGQGRLWLVEGDWQDGEQAPPRQLDAASRQLMRAMMFFRGPGVTIPGVQQDVPLAEVFDRGWRQCYAGTYDDRDDALADLLAACAGEQLMLACRPVGQEVLSLAAEGAFADVTFDVGDGRSDVRRANGVNWYFSDTSSWGFGPGGVAVERDSCDTNGLRGSERLCWHTSQGDLSGGWRCSAAAARRGSSTATRGRWANTTASAPRP